MAVVIIDEFHDVEDVVELMNYLARALASGNTEHLTEAGALTLTRGSEPIVAQLEDLVRLDEEDQECLVVGYREGCSCVGDAAATDPRQGLVVDAERHDGPVPYVLCPERGRHARLADCWMCWSDVYREAANRTEVLAPEGVIA